MGHFEKLRRDHEAKFEFLFADHEASKKRLDKLETICSQMSQDLQQVEVQAQQIKQMEVDQVGKHAEVGRMQIELAATLRDTRTALEARMDVFVGTTKTVEQHAHQLEQVEKFVESTKKHMHEEMGRLREEVADKGVRFDDTTMRLERSIEDTKYWIDQYNAAFKAAEGHFNSLRAEFLQEVEQLTAQLRLKPSAKDMHANFRDLSDVLLVKFGQLEDCKEGLRDMLVYQKFFFPLLVQSAISENLASFKPAMADHKCVQFQQKRYDQILEKARDLVEQTEKSQDVDIQRHIELLDKHHLKVSDWQFARNLQEHDFTGYLKQHYITDLRKRHAFSMAADAPVPVKIRKGVPIHEAQNLISALYNESVGLRAQLAAREAELEATQKHQMAAQKITRLVNEKIELKESDAFKRQNSYDPLLGFSWTVGDYTHSQQMLRAMRRSI